MPDQTPMPRWMPPLAYASAVVFVLSVALLAVRLALGPPVSSPTNPSRLIVESLDAISSASIAPLAYAFHQAYTRSSPALGRIAMWLGIASSMMQTFTSGLFLADVAQFGMGLWVNGTFVAGLLPEVAWLALGGSVAQSTGRLPRGALMGIVGATLAGYPVWAVWLGRRASLSSPPAEARTPPADNLLRRGED